METPYGIGLDQKTGEYTVIVNGRRVQSYPTLKSALAHADAHRAQEAK